MDLIVLVTHGPGRGDAWRRHGSAQPVPDLVRGPGWPRALEEGDCPGAQRHPRLRPDQAGKCDGMGWRKLKAKAGCRAGLPGRACPGAAGTPGGHAAWRRSTGEQEAGPSCQGGPGPPGAGQRSRGCGRDPDVRERKRVAGMQRRRSAGATERRGPARVQGEASRRLAAIVTQAPRVATGRHPPEGGRGGDQICKVWPACWNGGEWRYARTGQARGPDKTGGAGTEKPAEPGGARGARAAGRCIVVTLASPGRGCDGANPR